MFVSDSEDFKIACNKYCSLNLKHLNKIMAMLLWKYFRKNKDGGDRVLYLLSHGGGRFARSSCCG